MGTGRTQASHTPVPREERNFSSCSSEKKRIWSETSHAPCLSPRQLPAGNLRSLLILKQRTREGAPLLDMTPRGPRKEAVDV